MKTVLDSLIHEDQKGFISARCISENIRLIYDVLFETKNQELPGLIPSIGFEKAFNTVSWDFIERVLQYLILDRRLFRGLNYFKPDLNLV